VRARAFLFGIPLLRLAVMAALVVPMGLVAVPAHASDADEIPFNTARILEFHNAERAARGVGPLSRDPRLDQHAQQLAARGVLEHTPSYARTIGYPAGGQNLVYQGPAMNASQAHYLWMTSDNHRKNLLNPGFSHAGVGIACSRASGRPYPVAVVDFGGQTLSPSVPPQSPITVGANALSGHALVCDGTSAAPAPQPPTPAPAPQPPPPAPAPVPAAAPVAPRPAAPKPGVPRPAVRNPAPAPAAAPPIPAPPAPAAPAGPPRESEPPADPQPMAVAAAQPTSTEPEAGVLNQAAPASRTDARSVEGLLAFVVGCMAALVLAGVAGSFWFRRSPAAILSGRPNTGRERSPYSR
jgi:hypothetical protein